MNSSTPVVKAGNASPTLSSVWLIIIQFDGLSTNCAQVFVPSVEVLDTARMSKENSISSVDDHSWLPVLHLNMNVYLPVNLTSKIYKQLLDVLLQLFYLISRGGKQNSHGDDSIVTEIETSDICRLKELEEYSRNLEIEIERLKSKITLLETAGANRLCVSCMRGSVSGNSCGDKTIDDDETSVSCYSLTSTATRNSSTVNSSGSDSKMQTMLWAFGPHREKVFDKVHSYD